MLTLKILLVNPADPDSYLAPERWSGEPLALEYLGAAARLDGHETQLVDLRFEQQGIDEILSTYRPDVVATTAYTMHVKSARGVLLQTKAQNPDCITMVGGHHASLMPEDFFYPYVDHVVMGEGVSQFRAILTSRASGAGGEPHTLAGVWTRQGQDFNSDGTTPAYKIDDLPSPARDLTRQYRERYRISGPDPTALLQSAVGCVYRCSFCAQWRLLKGKHLTRAVARVVDELRTIEEEQIFFTDDEPFSDVERMFELAAAINKTGIKKRFYAYCRANDFTEQRDLLTAWKNVGLTGVAMGIEGVSQRELEVYNKRMSLAQVESAFQIAADIGIEVVAFFIVDPLYTRKDFDRLLRFIERHGVKNPLFSVLTPLPGTRALRNFDAITELDNNGRPNWDLFDFQTPVTRTHLPKEQFMQLYRRLWFETGEVQPGARVVI